jgi:hypothetical protein
MNFRQLISKVVLSTVVLVGAATTSPISQAPTASAAGGCGWSVTTMNWTITVWALGTHTVGRQEFRSDSCHDGTNYTTNGSGYHSCNKAGWAIANSITKDTSYGQAGGNRVTNTATCHFHGGLQIKGVGIGVTRDWNLQHQKHISNGTSYVNKVNWTSCC